MIHESAVHVRLRQTKQYRRTIDCTSDRDSALSKWWIARAIEVNRAVTRQTMDKLAFTPAIDIPLSCVTLLAFLIHFNVWARSRPVETNVNLKSRLPTARIRVVSLIVGMVSVCWLLNFPVWVVFGLLAAVGFGAAVIVGNDGDASGALFFFVAFMIREWSFGFPLIILHPEQNDSKTTSLGEMYNELVGMQGKVVSPLRPFGEAELVGRLTTVVSETGELLDIGTDIIVTDVKNGRICVRPVLHSENVR